MLKKSCAIVMATLALTACQTLPQTHTLTNDTHTALQFVITGKIGITTITANGKEAVSAFYTWHQQDKRFAIDLTGALGMGATSISFDGKTAKFVGEDANTMTADSPEELLYQATGWQAPISQLSYWVMGKIAPDDIASVFEHGQLVTSTNQDWSASFEYPKNSHQPNRLTMTHIDGHKVVMTIAHP